MDEQVNLIYLVQNEEILSIYWKPIISKYFVTVTDSNTFNTNLLVQTATSEFFKISLNGLLSINFGSYCCLRCGNTNSTISSRLCAECKTSEEEAFENCLFRSPHTIYENKCLIEKPACNEKSNIEKCFRDYYLYFGRFGEHIKVGISRLSLGKFKYRRPIEQGLNEAIVVYPFRSLNDVTAAERRLIDEFGMKESITFLEKVSSLEEPCMIKIEDYYPIKQIRELFIEKNIKQLSLYPDNPLNNILSGESILNSEKFIDQLKGSIIFTQGNIGLLKQCQDLTFFDISKLVGRVIENDEQW